MRMSKKMRELRDQIQAKSKELQSAIENSDAEAATRARNEIENLRALHDAAAADFDARQGLETDPDEGNDGGVKATYNAELFFKAVAHKELSEEERKVIAQARNEYTNRFSEGTQKDGGLTVPDDVSSEIENAIRSTESVRNLVRVDNATSATGSRNFSDADGVKLYNTAEHEEIKEMKSKEYRSIEYKQKKFAGLMPISSELLEDSAINFKNEVVDWMSEASRNTENAQIFYGAGGEKHCQGLLSTAGAFKEVDGTTISIDFLRRVYLSLPAGYRINAKWIMNSLAFAAVSELKFEDGRSCIQPDPRTEDGYKLFGFPIAIFDTIETDEDDNTTEIAFGDFTRAYRMFVRRQFGMSFTDTGAGAFETDSIMGKGTERFDGKIFDRKAAIIIRNVPVTDLETTGGDAEIVDELSEATLKNLTKKQLVELAGDLGVEGVTTEQTKDAIVSAILTAKGE